MKYKNFMPCALDMAKLAFERGEVPVGAVIVKDGEIIASAHQRNGKFKQRVTPRGNSRDRARVQKT